MGFTNQGGAVSYFTREKYDLDVDSDRMKVLAFEKELAEYEGRSVTAFGRILSGFDLYLHECNMFRYSERYRNGAVVELNIQKYRDVRMKKRALDDLLLRRKFAREQEEEMNNSITENV